jgi:hypothetical protein
LYSKKLTIEFMKNKTDLTQSDLQAFYDTYHKRPTSDLQAITMSLTCHTIANAECTGVFIQEKYEAYSYRYNVPNSKVYRYGIMGDYHLFIRSGDKSLYGSQRCRRYCDFICRTSAE